MFDATQDSQSDSFTHSPNPFEAKTKKSFTFPTGNFNPTGNSKPNEKSNPNENFNVPKSDLTINRVEILIEDYCDEFNEMIDYMMSLKKIGHFNRISDIQYNPRRLRALPRLAVQHVTSY